MNPGYSSENVSIPVLSNGNILYFDDIAACMEATGADGVMVAGMMVAGVVTS